MPRWRLILAFVVVLLISTSARAQEPSLRYQAEAQPYDAKLLAELEALEPDVSDIWRQANDAREAGDLEAAITNYTVVLADQPGWDHALRRRCTVYLEQGQVSLALGDCRAAHERNPRPENALALAKVLAAESVLRDPTRAKALATEALRDAKNEYMALHGVCEVALALPDEPLLGQCSTRMRELDDTAWEGHVFTAFHHLLREEHRKAAGALERAHEAGLDDVNYRELLANFERVEVESEPPWSYYGKRIALPILLWIGLALALIGIGFALSRATLAEAETALGNRSVSARARDSRLHRAYAAVLWLCCAYYYISVPLILITMVALGAGLIIGMLYVGFVSIKLLLIVLVGVAATVFAVIASFFKRPKDVPPGELLDLREAPRLRALLDEVAGQIGTRPVDHVYLSPGAEIAVFERGGLWAKLRGKGERCLLLGVAVLDGLDERALRAILAHEYGHFSNEDTAGGNFALGVRRSILHSAMGLAEMGVAGWHNPAWAFLNGFNSLFLRVSQGASRLQEVLADRWAARTYGADAFERGLRHAIAADLRFDFHANATVNEVIEARHGLRNLYTFAPSKLPEQAGRVDEFVEQIVTAEASPYDSHPRPADRFRWVRALSDGASETGIGEPAWALFEDRGRVQERMTAVICARVAEQTGMVIPADEAERVRRRAILDG
jgi:Zn-dependent protease with chaperone function